MNIPLKPSYQLDKEGENIYLAQTEALFFDFIPYQDQLYFVNQSVHSLESLKLQYQKIEKLFGKEQSYEQFLKKKYKKAVFDIYACFQPFNEATKAFYPFIKKLQSELKPNDYILNVWDRSGWMSFLLAGLFPQQHIITIWEGNHDILGYKGFKYWFKDQKNISVIFSALDKPLPLADNSCALVIAPDTLHRFEQTKYLNELTRVAHNEAAIFFPHVHLSNTQPVPFFERGGLQLHGKDYASRFKHVEAQSNWMGKIFSEPKLFTFNDFIENRQATQLFNSDPNTIDYNALIALLPKAWQADSLQAYEYTAEEYEGIERVLLNELLKIDYQQQKVSIDRASFNGQLGYLLERHPIYVERIKALENYTFDAETAQILFLAQRAYNLHEIRNFLGKENIIERVLELQKIGLLQVLPIAEKGILLQNYLVNQSLRLPLEKQQLQNLWQTTVKTYTDKVAICALEDESELSYADCDELVQLIVSALLNQGLRKGDKVLLCSSLHMEGVFIFWACMQLGLVFVPISSELPLNVMEGLITRTNAKISFVNASVYKERKILFESPILLDSEEQFESVNYFSEWLEENVQEEVVLPNILPQDQAVILFTSGSTGMPKGVVLTQGDLYRSSELLAKHFHFDSSDKYFAFGGLESMSGLRNATLSALHFGTSVVIPRQHSLENLFSLVEEIEESKASILGANPSFLRQLVKHQDRFSYAFKSIRTLMCTGNVLSEDLRKSFHTAFKIEPLNYYGLTETSGICIAESENEKYTENSIGKPIDCIAQVVDEVGNILPQGRVGELRIFSENLMKIYDQNDIETAEVIRDSWFYTEDLARINKEGQIELTGRKKAFIKTAKEEIIYLDHLQSFIKKQVEIDDVAICSLHEQDVETIHAFIVLKPFADPVIISKNLREAIRERYGVTAVPKHIHFKKELAYTKNGKLFKQKLKDEASEYSRTLLAT